MGQMTRERKYADFWALVDNTIDARVEAIDMLLRLLPDKQLDDSLIEIAKMQRCGDNDENS